ncbi:TIGR01458 family HAD-type hydrolase [Leptolyngbya sp. PCC 6406]|uniref:TIGR01458 family HAD-type hydrolase n=1 Tax=Leptolyngbya sp. PCC 6406 TaxID=1173264 RepID=UPI0002AC2394|nr:TIGR01458 family HAD-type hydrolase [Leptolyngbya sp. PCC 6406]
MVMDGLGDIKGLLLDLNGVFYVANRALPGAVATVEALQESGLPYRFVTNNTTESIQSLSQGLKSMGLPIDPVEIISAPYAAVLHLRQMGQPKIYPLLSENAQQDFAEFPISDTQADVVVIGDMGDEWNYRVLNRAFRLVMQGAQVIALHKGKFWQWEAGLQLDIGAFVVGLEYATDADALVVGKPNPFFFKMALAELGLPPEQVAMVGDDIEADVAGAQGAGLKGVLVKTGKYRPHFVDLLGIQPDLELESISAIATWLGS